ncbi:MAG: response regulator [Deltaproteobacteria bacterium]|nr:response regulator [Deltaproteobacteria bacterium]
MKNKKPVIAAAFANPVDRKLVADYLSGLGYDLVEFPWDGVPPADLFILDVPWARRLGRQVIELKKRTDVFLPAMIALGSRDPVDPWLDAGFDSPGIWRKKARPNTRPFSRPPARRPCWWTPTPPS